MNEIRSRKGSGWTVGIVVPACNEESSVEACIDSITEAIEATPLVTDSWIVVAADSCQDRTADLARARLARRGCVVECAAASPGVARRLGAEEALRHFTDHPLGRVWIANTDADSCPSKDWIHQQLSLAEQGYCAVAGIVRVESIGELRPETIHTLLDDYVLHSDGSHPHVHGANLGFRADAYLDAGGWSDLRVAEDHCLWARVRAKGWRVASSIGSVVTTSGRLIGRAAGGFADRLRGKVERQYA